MKALVLVVVATVAACSTCEDAADIQVTLDLDAALGRRVATLDVVISVNGGPRQLSTVQTGSGVASGQTVLLRPSAAPVGETYDVAVDIIARDDTGTIVLRGAQRISAAAHACNRVELQLSPDGPVGDLATADLAVADHAACGVGAPDEDGDGLADDCDVCAAIADPTPSPNGDLDALPDVCDPNPTTPGNVRLYFEPFNAAPSGWTGSFSIGGGAATIATDSIETEVVATNVATTFTPSIMAQVVVTPTAVSAGITGGVRVYLWKNGTTAGYRCEMGWRANGSSVVSLVELGVAPSTDPAELSAFTIGKTYRISMFAVRDPATQYVGCVVDEVGGDVGLGGMKMKTTLTTGDVLRLGIGAGLDPGSSSGTVTARFGSLFATSYVLP